MSVRTVNLNGLDQRSIDMGHLKLTQLLIYPQTLVRSRVDKLYWTTLSTITFDLISPTPERDGDKCFRIKYRKELDTEPLLFPNVNSPNIYSFLLKIKESFSLIFILV